MVMAVMGFTCFQVCKFTGKKKRKGVEKAGGKGGELGT